MKPVSSWSWASFLGLILVLLVVLPCSNALELVKRNDSPSVISLDIQRRVVENPAERDRLRKRASQTVQATLDNEVRILTPILSPFEMLDMREAFTYLRVARLRCGIANMKIANLVFLQSHSGYAATRFTTTHRHRQ